MTSPVQPLQVSRDKPHRVHDAIWFSRLESAGALLLSFFINLALVTTNATHFYSQTCAEADADGAPFACLGADVYSDLSSHLDGEGDHCTTATISDGRCAQVGLQARCRRAEPSPPPPPGP